MAGSSPAMTPDAGKIMRISPSPAGSDSVNWRRPGPEFLMRRVVYTCLFGHSELFNDFQYERDGIDFVCFTDAPELRSDFWKIELLPRKVLDPARASKKLKALSHIYLAQYDLSLYVDNTVRLKVAPNRFFEEFLVPSKSALACFRHHERDCIYD